jgi:hypothetical protein
MQGCQSAHAAALHCQGHSHTQHPRSRSCRRWEQVQSRQAVRQSACLHNEVGPGLPRACQLGADAGVGGRQLPVRQAWPVLADGCGQPATWLRLPLAPPAAWLEAANCSSTRKQPCAAASAYVNWHCSPPVRMTSTCVEFLGARGVHGVVGPLVGVPRHPLRVGAKLGAPVQRQRQVRPQPRLLRHRVD